jgi:hypothetical protein
MTTTELQQALTDAHNARVEARLIRAGVPDGLLWHGVRLLEGELELDASPELIDMAIASWRVQVPSIFGGTPATSTAMTREPGSPWGALGAAEAARRTAPSPTVPAGSTFGSAGTAEALKRYPPAP